MTANAAGVYTFSGIPDGTYTVTPSKTGFVFAPTSQPVTITGGLSATGVDFTGTPVPTWTVSGTVSGGGTGVAVALSGAATASTTADPVTGAYSFTGLQNGSYTITPTKAGFTMTPANRPVVVNGANMSGVDFSAQPVPTFSLSGTITPLPLGAGATVALTGTSVPSVTTDTNGNYTFTGLSNGSYTVTPTKGGATMSPLNRLVTIAGANVGGINFTATANTSIPVRDVNVALGRSNKATTVVSPSFSTTATNELLLALVAADNVNAAATTVTNVTGGGLTWVLVRRTNTQKGTAEIWRAFAPAIVTNATVTATLSQSVAAFVTVMSFKGVDTTGTNGSGAIGATASGAAASGAPTATLTTTRANSIVVGIGDDWDSATAANSRTESDRGPAIPGHDRRHVLGATDQQPRRAERHGGDDQRHGADWGSVQPDDLRDPRRELSPKSHSP